MNKPRTFDVVVIGSGPAGQKSAIQFSKSYKKVALVEQENMAGGACVHRGTIPSKTLRETACQLARLRENIHCISSDLPEHVELSSLMRQVNNVTRAHDRYMSHQLERNGITRIHGKARLVSENRLHIRKINGDVEPVDAGIIVIATGSRPRNPDDVPIDHENILDSDSILSLGYLPGSLTVIGAGVIACEYASIFATLGTEVTLIDQHDCPMGFLDRELSENFLASFRSSGGEFIGNTQVESYAWDGVSSVVVTLSNGGLIRSEKVLFALGRQANTEGLGLEDIGLELTPRGMIAIDETCRTNLPIIYAVGDVTGPPALASTAMEQGRRAACHAMEIMAEKSFGPIPMGIYTIPEISTIGLTEDEAREQHTEILVGRAHFSEIARGQISNNQNGLLKMISDLEGNCLLGVQIIGEGATELVHIGQMALISGISIETFVENIFNFPTLAEAYRVAALDIRSQAKKRSAALSQSETNPVLKTA